MLLLIKIKLKFNNNLYNILYFFALLMLKDTFYLKLKLDELQNNSCDIKSD